ncbi:MAG: exodeoxyribonuclease VII small subunit [Clostridia bacterium]|nr:exodeoxyribonuclease VII small subunit [Clostridia bacterium]
MAKKNNSFESSIERLEEIINQLENGNQLLDESLALFEEGVGLIKLCNQKLENVEKSINLLVNNDGELIERKFKPDDEQ